MGRPRSRLNDAYFGRAAGTGWPHTKQEEAPEGAAAPAGDACLRWLCLVEHAMSKSLSLHAPSWSAAGGPLRRLLPEADVRFAAEAQMNVAVIAPTNLAGNPCDCRAPRSRCVCRLPAAAAPRPGEAAAAATRRRAARGPREGGYADWADARAGLHLAALGRVRGRGGAPPIGPHPKTKTRSPEHLNTICGEAFRREPHSPMKFYLHQA